MMSVAQELPRAAAGGDGGLKSVLAALDLLECFELDEELGVSEVARRLGVAKSTAHRLLTTLCARDLAEKNPETGMYRLGLRLYELGQLAVGRHRLRRHALPLMEELRQITGCTVHLAIPDGPDVVYVERLESLKGMPLFIDVGRRFPAHATSSGRAIAAFDPDLAQARREAGFQSSRGGKITCLREFETALEQVRRTGVALQRDEVVLGLTAVAAPIRGQDGSAHAAISLVGLTSDYDAQGGRNAHVVTVAATKLARVVNA